MSTTPDLVTVTEALAALTMADQAPPLTEPFQEASDVINAHKKEKINVKQISSLILYESILASTNEQLSIDLNIFNRYRVTYNQLKNKE